MRQLRVWTVIVLVFCLLCGAALADVVGVTSNGDGTVDIEWDNQDDGWLLWTVKMSESYEDDLKTYGFRRFTADTKRMKSMTYYMAPGQSYWVFTQRTDGTYTQPYSFDAPGAKKFTAFKKQPHFTEWKLAQKDINGKQSKVNYFDHRNIEEKLEMMSFGLVFRYAWPDLRKQRSYLGQAVITSPDGDKYVNDSFDQTLPVGRAYAYNNYYSLDKYFESMLAMRDGTIPIGTYYYSLYWDGKLVCSETFRVR